jgi:hypothetical protein
MADDVLGHEERVEYRLGGFKSNQSTPAFDIFSPWLARRVARSIAGRPGSDYLGSILRFTTSAGKLAVYFTLK